MKKIGCRVGKLPAQNNTISGRTRIWTQAAGSRNCVLNHQACGGNEQLEETQGYFASCAHTKSFIHIVPPFPWVYLTSLVLSGRWQRKLAELIFALGLEEHSKIWQPVPSFGHWQFHALTWSGHCSLSIPCGTQGMGSGGCILDISHFVRK